VQHLLLSFSPCIAVNLGRRITDASSAYSGSAGSAAALGRVDLRAPDTALLVCCLSLSPLFFRSQALFLLPGALDLGLLIPIMPLFLVLDPALVFTQLDTLTVFLLAPLCFLLTLHLLLGLALPVNLPLLVFVLALLLPGLPVLISPPLFLRLPLVVAALLVSLPLAVTALFVSLPLLLLFLIVLLTLLAWRLRLRFTVLLSPIFSTPAPALGVCETARAKESDDAKKQPQNESICSLYFH